MPDPAARAREIIDSNQYLTLATADAQAGRGRRPSGSPTAATGSFSGSRSRTPDIPATSRAGRRSRSSSFDSTVALGTGGAVYAEATAARLDGPDAAGPIEAFSLRSLECGGRAWTPDDVGPSAALRLYRATASSLFILGENDERIAVDLA